MNGCHGAKSCRFALQTNRTAARSRPAHKQLSGVEGEKIIIDTLFFRILEEASKHELYPAAPTLPAMTSGGRQGAAGERRRRPGVGMEITAGAGEADRRGAENDTGS